MTSIAIVPEGVRGVIAATADIATDEAYPEICLRMADSAFVQRSAIFSFSDGGVERTFDWVVLCVATNRAAATTPFLEAGTVKDVLAQNGKKPRRFIHALKADRAGW